MEIKTEEKYNIHKAIWGELYNGNMHKVPFFRNINIENIRINQIIVALWLLNSINTLSFLHFYAWGV